jgi:hypothetical protein
VLAAKGMVAFLAVAAAAIAPAVFRPTAAGAGAPSVPVDAEIVRVWSRMVFAHAP